MQGALPTAGDLRVEGVSDLTRRLRGVLEADFATVWVAGEISNFHHATSGHFYFSLKDARSQIAAVMFRSSNQRLPFRPEDGLEVIVRGRVSLYDARGALQLYVDAMAPRGLGVLQLALEQLKQRLAAEGLFDPARKRPLPFWPRAVGVVTAITGAAIHDIVTTARRRMPSARIVIRPVRVQGAQAGADIAAALADLQTVPEVDVVIVGRGGGSAEDLWAFNEERVARAIAAARVPVVSAVGHEIDVTLADLAADHRAATPTAAAVLVMPDVAELLGRVERARAALQVGMRRQIERRRVQLRALSRHVRDPRQQLRMQRLRIDELAERARRAVDAVLRSARQEHRGCAEQLQALSPLAVLQRGYAIAQPVGDDAVVRSARQLQPADRLRVTFAQGWALVTVEDVRD